LRNRVVSVTRRYIEFLFERDSEMHARDDVKEIFRRIAVEDADLLARLADGPLATTDDSHVGEDVE
jgi:hypothetical protein